MSLTLNIPQVVLIRSTKIAKFVSPDATRCRALVIHIVAGSRVTTGILPPFAASAAKFEVKPTPYIHKKRAVHLLFFRIQVYTSPNRQKMASGIKHHHAGWIQSWNASIHLIATSQYGCNGTHYSHSKSIFQSVNDTEIYSVSGRDFSIIRPFTFASS